ncbi:MAG: mobile mystery protein B [Alphaproteobacteria bacterium]
MSDPFNTEDGQTPLTADDRLGLIPGHIQTRGELDELEGANINTARRWIAGRRSINALSVDQMREVHRQMFDQVWTWAGEFTQEADRGLGLPTHDIPSALQMLVDDIAYQLEHANPESAELLANYHHRLTYIHPFPNGNGRWARLMTDLLGRRIDAPTIEWGGRQADDDLHQVGAQMREAYIAALRVADGHDLDPLINLIRDRSAAS